MDKVMVSSRKVAIAIAGFVVVVIGLVLIPYPGPGWLIVFAGLAILATEFHFAKRVLHWARGKYDAWKQWVSCQLWPLQIVIVSLTVAVVLLTLWVCNAFGILVGLFDIDAPWAVSPIFA